MARVSIFITASVPCRVNPPAHLRAFTHSGVSDCSVSPRIICKIGLRRCGPGIATPVHMAYVITDTCTKEELCVQACPVDCIHPKQHERNVAEPQHLYVNPNDCIDCGACIPVCPTNSIYTLEELPAEFASFAELNANRSEEHTSELQSLRHLV